MPPEVDGLVYVDNLSGMNVKVGDVIKEPSQILMNMICGEVVK